LPLAFSLVKIAIGKFLAEASAKLLVFK